MFPIHIEVHVAGGTAPLAEWNSKLLPLELKAGPLPLGSPRHIFRMWRGLRLLLAEWENVGAHSLFTQRSSGEDAGDVQQAILDWPRDRFPNFHA